MRFEYYRSKKDRQWYWRLRAVNGKTIAVSSEGYSREDGCLHSIKLVKSASQAKVELVSG